MWLIITGIGFRDGAKVHGLVRDGMAWSTGVRRAVLTQVKVSKELEGLV